MRKRNLILINLNAGQMLNLGKVFSKPSEIELGETFEGDVYSLLEHAIWDKQAATSERFVQHMFALTSFIIASRGQMLTVLDRETLSNVIDKAMCLLDKKYQTDNSHMMPENDLSSTNSAEILKFIKDNWRFLEAKNNFEGEGLILPIVEETLSRLIERKIFEENLPSIDELSDTDLIDMIDYKYE